MRELPAMHLTKSLDTYSRLLLQPILFACVSQDVVNLGSPSTLALFSNHGNSMGEEMRTHIRGVYSRVGIIGYLQRDAVIAPTKKARKVIKIGHTAHRDGGGREKPGLGD